MTILHMQVQRLHCKWLLIEPTCAAAWFFFLQIVTEMELSILFINELKNLETVEKNPWKQFFLFIFL